MNILWWHPFKDLAEDVASKISDAVTAIFALLVRSIYTLFSNAIDMVYSLARRDLGLGSFIEDITEKLFYFFIIFMVFKLTFSILTYLINPDSFTDKEKGIQSILKRVIISVALLVFINPIFDTLTEIQNDIIDNNLIQNVFISTEKASGNLNFLGGKIYPVHMSDYCDSNRYVYTFSQGDHMALMLFKEFYTAKSDTYLYLDLSNVNIENHSNVATDVITMIPGGSLVNDSFNFLEQVDSDGVSAMQSINTCSDEKTCYCGTSSGEFLFNAGTIEYDANNPSEWKKEMAAVSIGPNNVKEFLTSEYYNADYIDFDFFMATFAGIFGLLIAISFTFDVVIRSLTLFILQLVAPIPIISYMSPEKKSSELLTIWLKKLGSTWLSVFIRIMALSLGVSLISYMSNMLDGNGNATSIIMKLFIFLGTLMFAKKLPQLLEELFPGLKINSNFQLNPFKRVHDEALGGKYITGAAGALGGAALSGVGQTAGNMIAFRRGRQNLKKQIAEAKSKGDFKKAARLQNRLNNMNLARFAGTTLGGITGGARRGLLSGYKTGESGDFNVLKNVKSDTQKGNAVRNTRSAIRDFNNDVKHNAGVELRDVNAKFNADSANLANQLRIGAISKADYKSQMKALKQNYKNSKDDIMDNAKDQRYTWFERNVSEPADRFAGVKNEYGGYGYYNEQIEDLNKKINNKRESEMAMRNALANKLSGGPVSFDKIEELRSELVKNSIDFYDSSGRITADAQRVANNIASKYGIAPNVLTSVYDANHSDVSGITALDNEQKELKAQKSVFEDMMKAREEAQNGNK